MTKSCSSCLYLNKANCDSNYEPCVSCNDDHSGFVPMTNGDRVRAMHVMDNNELAELLSDLQREERRPPWEWREWLEKQIDISK